MPEILVEDGVDDRIEGRVDVAEPKGEGKAPGLDVALRAHGRQEVEEEEREPARDEGPHDEAQDEGGPLLPRPVDPPPLSGRVHVLPHHHPARINHLCFPIKDQRREKIWYHVHPDTLSLHLDGETEGSRWHQDFL